MANSILDSVKKSLGLTANYDVFDPDILMHINSALATLNQIGIGPADGFMVEDDQATWEMFLGTDTRLTLAKSYTYFKVRLAFDPPTTSYHIQALKDQIQEYEWRLSVHRESRLDSVSVTIPAEAEVDGGGAQHL